MSETANQKVWKNCSTCKKPILAGQKYYICSVSSCNGQRTGYVFCSMQCFESHLPGARHRDAGAIEKIADKAPARIMVAGAPSAPTAPASKKTPEEVLIIASRLKDYIQAKADYNTSASVMDVLSSYVRILCDRAIDHARSEGRRTVMDRDFEFLKDL